MLQLMLMMLAGYALIDQKGPADAHDAGRVRPDLIADAHNARRVCLDLIKRVQLMLMMLAGYALI